MCVPFTISFSLLLKKGSRFFVAYLLSSRCASRGNCVVGDATLALNQRVENDRSVKFNQSQINDFILCWVQTGCFCIQDQWLPLDDVLRPLHRGWTHHLLLDCLLGFLFGCSPAIRAKENPGAFDLLPSVVVLAEPSIAFGAGHHGLYFSPPSP